MQLLVNWLFDELATIGRPLSLEDCNLYIFHGLHDKFKDLVTSLVTKVEPLSYMDLHIHLLTHEFLHNSSLPSFVVLYLSYPATDRSRGG